jgi:hypothetical protein
MFLKCPKIVTKLSLQFLFLLLLIFLTNTKLPEVAVPLQVDFK